VQFWAQRTRETAERAPCLITIGGNPVDAWVFWREVWAWGGPEEVHKNKVRGGGQLPGRGGLLARVQVSTPAYALCIRGMQTPWP
jgi:hypothetical protein